MERISLEECLERKLCALCEKGPLDDEWLCPPTGCGNYVCEDCSKNDNLPFFGHDVIDHELDEDMDDMDEDDE